MADRDQTPSLDRPQSYQRPIPATIPSDTDQAVDESSDVDGEFAQLQKTISQKRRAAKDSPEARLKHALPFPFVPTTRPLTASDWEACVALENAAFPDPAHRASPEKVGSYLYRLE